MIIDCVSDLHGHEPRCKGGDLLIVAGDLTAYGKRAEFVKFGKWLARQQYTNKVVIAGNHDAWLEEQKDNPEEIKQVLGECHYLNDSGCQIEGLNVWGSPITPMFCGWHFMRYPSDIQYHWALIPDNTDILVTHGPPDTILDKPDYAEERCGCSRLFWRIIELKPKLHVFGHIHHSRGFWQHSRDSLPTLFVNCAYLNDCYRYAGPPLRVIWDGEKMSQELPKTT